MAYEPYRPSDQLPYPPYDYPDARPPYQSPSAFYQPPPFPQDPSQARSPQSAPIYDAVNTAFDKSQAANQVDPSLIAQITEEVRRQVIDSLKNTNVSSAGPSQPRPTPQQQPPSFASLSPTGSTTTSAPPRNVYTPPSPDRRDYSGDGTHSPGLHSQGAGYLDVKEIPPWGYDGGKSSASNLDDTGPRSRPPTIKRTLTSEEETTLERIWQPLFDLDGQPTLRLGQFLRGLAIHIIEAYEPKRSIVITPMKMRNFYEDVRVSDETYPWKSIFQLPSPTISKIYRDLKCQHHLVQDEATSVPSIPALTPVGFQSWMTNMILAHPDIEFDRLAKAVMNMPICNADDLKERLPKELPPRLFPKRFDLQARQRCIAALSADGKIPIPTDTLPPPPPAQPPGAFPASFERERSPYSGTKIPESGTTEQVDNHTPLAVPIERERKPYSAQPGCGKVYDDGNLRPADYDVHPQPTASTRDTYSSSNRASDYQPTGTTSSRYRAGSSAASTRRPRSPSFSGGGYGTRSEGNVSNVSSDYYSASNLQKDEDEENRKFAQEAESKRKDWARRQAEEDDSSRGSYSSRRDYDDEYYRGRGGGNGYGYAQYPPRY